MVMPRARHPLAFAAAALALLLAWPAAAGTGKGDKPAKAPAPAKPVVLGAPFQAVTALVKPSVEGEAYRLVKVVNKKVNCGDGLLEPAPGLAYLMVNVTWKEGHEFTLPSKDGKEAIFFWDEMDDARLVYAEAGKVTLVSAPTEPGATGRIRVEAKGPEASKNNVPEAEFEFTVCEY